MIDKSKLTEIRNAIRNHDLDSLKSLVDGDPNLLRLDSAFGSILHIALGTGSSEIVRWLLEQGVDPNVKSSFEEISCLNRAIGKRNLELVRLLIEHGAKLDTTETVKNPLYSAIYYGEFEIAKLLIDRGLDVNVQYNAKPPHTNALLFAKTWGRTDIVKLIESKLPHASPDAGTLMTGSDTKSAARTKAARSAKPKSKAEPEKGTGVGIENCPPSADPICELKDTSIMNDQTRDSVLNSIENDDLESLKKIVESDKSLLMMDSVFGSVLHMAVDHGNLLIVQWLMNHGADPNIKSEQEELSCLSYAIGKKNIELVRILLDHGASLDTTDTLSNPIFGAIYYGEFEIAKLLIDRGLDVNVQYKAKPPHTNALLFAKTWGRTDIVKLIESKLPQPSTDAGNLTTESATTSAATTRAAKSAKPKSRVVKIDQANDWSLHYVFEGEKPVRFREFRISGNSLWTTQGDVMTWGDTQQSDFESPAEAARAFGNACEQALSDGFELYRSGDADKTATDRKVLTLEIQQGAKKAFEATRRNHPDAPPAMFGLQSDEDATLIVSVSNPRIDIDSVDKDELERVWILNLWEYDEGSEYLDPAYRLLLLPHHGDPLPSGGLSPEKVYDCFIDALAALRKEGFFGSVEENPVVLFQVLDSLAHVDQNKKLNSPDIYRKYRSWVTGG